MCNIIKIKNLNIYYGSYCALKNINLEVKEKDFLGVIGPNGAGKSTLVKSIVGLVSPDKGSVKIYGKEPQKAKSLIGYVPQGSKFDSNFPIDVLDTVLMGRLSSPLKMWKKYNSEDISIAQRLMNSLDIDNLKHRQIGQLSMGQLQRVLIARALVAQPKILVLDEPTASVDSVSKTIIYDILKKLNEEMTIIVVTHDMTAVSSYVKNIACLNQTLFYHGQPNINSSIVQKTFGCPIDLIAHGIPHRVLEDHGEGIK